MGLIDTNRLSRFLTNLKSGFAKQSMESQKDLIFLAESSDGVAYTATVPGVTDLYVGLRITIKPSRNSSSTAPTLNVNGLGAKTIRQPLPVNNVATAPGALPTWIGSGCTVTVTYTGTTWKTEYPRPSASYMYGTVPIESGGTGGDTAEEALTNLGAASVTYVDEKIAALTARIEALESS